MPLRPRTLCRHFLLRQSAAVCIAVLALLLTQASRIYHVSRLINVHTTVKESPLGHRLFLDSDSSTDTWALAARSNTSAGPSHLPQSSPVAETASFAELHSTGFHYNRPPPAV